MMNFAVPGNLCHLLRKGCLSVAPVRRLHFALTRGQRANSSISVLKPIRNSPSFSICKTSNIKLVRHFSRSVSLRTANSVMEDSQELQDVVATLKELFPLEFAADWDNVGLLLQPSGLVFVKNILVTNDLTEQVLDEAISRDVQMIFSYHPPLFKSFKRLNQSSWKERITVRCMENRIAVYSPHTAVDAIKGGINDWLLSPFECCDVKPIERTWVAGKRNGLHEYLLYFRCTNVEFINQLSKLNLTVFPESDSNFHVGCSTDMLAKILSLGTMHDVTIKVVNQSPKLPLENEGYGRIAKLANSTMTIKDVTETVKKFLGLPNLRLALSNIHTKETKVTSIAVCAGSGASVLAKVHADVLITGEMSHHEVLDAVHRGSTVILCEHSNTERGFFRSILQNTFEQHFQKTGVKFLLSEFDSDPINII